ncbi:hypothetical protein J3998_10970 [Thiomicrorhabdus sp. 6S2-11]|jgi:hypothetical protein|uniref:Uncharacterized protein n=1 Tax=Thiomicrorhabdus marina TaxID=2818442 RepID=A0ABS3Q7I8_9GAMM|nr:hypothetical protein [Thiomicrorhabdus marina]MBO1928098.1 hypothetical protein [Thiomicrorhabdus marina]
MSLYDESNYEFSLRDALPGNSRDLVMHLFTTTSLAQMLQLWENRETDKFLLTKYRVNASDWPAALQAAIIAKLSYLKINNRYSIHEMVFLIKTTCAVLGTPLPEYTLQEVINNQNTQTPKLNLWLMKLAQMAQIKKAG